jgi:hypothetical protein
MMPELNDYQFVQLTHQSECHIHTHPRQQLNTDDSNQLQSAERVVAVSGGATLSLAHKFVTTDPASGSVTVILPPALNGKEYVVTQISAGTTVLDANGADTIIGAGTYSLTTQWQSVRLKATDGLWLLV